MGVCVWIQGTGAVDTSQNHASSRKQKQRDERRRRRKYCIAFCQRNYTFHVQGDIGRAKACRRFCVPFIYHSLCEWCSVAVVAAGAGMRWLEWDSCGMRPTHTHTDAEARIYLLYLFMLLLPECGHKWEQIATRRRNG